jgi:NTP pyrophosphatase (non-canonical NTP hydrolase)
MSDPFDLNKLQDKLERWTIANFGPKKDRKPVAYRTILGAYEELGELSHAHLKKEQGIRGTEEEHDANARDAIGDTIFYLIDYCNLHGWNLEEILNETWENVRERDWTKERVENGKNCFNAECICGKCD